MNKLEILQSGHRAGMIWTKIKNKKLPYQLVLMIFVINEKLLFLWSVKTECVSLCLLMSPYVSLSLCSLLVSPRVLLCLHKSPLYPHIFSCLLMFPRYSSCLLVSPHVSLCLLMSPCVISCLLLSPHVFSCLLVSPHVSFCLLMSSCVFSWFRIHTKESWQSCHCCSLCSQMSQERYNFVKFASLAVKRRRGGVFLRQVL